MPVNDFASLSLRQNVFAESLFMKDGSIVDGTIIKESNRSMVIRLKNKLKIIVPRKRILRVLYNEDYKKKMFIYMKDGVLV